MSLIEKLEALRREQAVLEGYVDDLEEASTVRTPFNVGCDNIARVAAINSAERILEILNDWKGGGL